MRVDRNSPDYRAAFAMVADRLGLPREPPAEASAVAALNAAAPVDAGAARRARFTERVTGRDLIGCAFDLFTRKLV